MLHYLLRKGYVPNIIDEATKSTEIVCNDVVVNFARLERYPQEFVHSLEQADLLTLFRGVIEYYCTEFDVFTSVATLRRGGEVGGGQNLTLLDNARI